MGRWELKRKTICRISNALVFLQNKNLQQCHIQTPDLTESAPWCLPPSSPNVFQHQYLSFPSLIQGRSYLNGTWFPLQQLPSEDPSFLIYSAFPKNQNQYNQNKATAILFPSTPCDHQYTNVLETKLGGFSTSSIRKLETIIMEIKTK